jgi:signal transduction histidine kinase
LSTSAVPIVLQPIEPKCSTLAAWPRRDAIARRQSVRSLFVKRSFATSARARTPLMSSRVSSGSRRSRSPTTSPTSPARCGRRRSGSAWSRPSVSTAASSSGSGPASIGLRPAPFAGVSTSDPRASPSSRPEPALDLAAAQPYGLTFPGAFAPEGLLGAGLQSPPWLYFLWHVGFPLSVTAYALLKNADPSKQRWKGTLTTAILLSAAVVVAAVCAATLLVTAGHALLPRLLRDTVSSAGPLYQSSAARTVLVNAVVALMVLWIRRGSVLDLWLMVVLCDYVIEISLFMTPVVVNRYSFGWYAGRFFGLISGTLVLFVLLYEITTLYARLVNAVLAQRREREARLMTGDAVSASIAHEVNQPLSAIIATADAGLNWLTRAVPDLEEVKAALTHIAADGHRAGAIIGGIRAMFKQEVRARAPLDVNEIIRGVLAAVHDELARHRVSVQVELTDSLPWVNGDRVQLQQVLLNLTTNAIESMATTDEARALGVTSEIHAPGGVMVTVKDTGTGVAPGDVDRIFTPLFTTKRHGMGMGLSISRAIIEAHAGRLWSVPNAPRGSVFHFVLPTDAAMAAGRQAARHATDAAATSQSWRGP